MHKQEALETFLAACFKARVPMYKVCQRAGVAQSTTSRWKKNPDSITASTMDRLEWALSEIEAERHVTCGLCGRSGSDPKTRNCDQFGCPLRKDEA